MFSNVRSLSRTQAEAFTPFIPARQRHRGTGSASAGAGARARLGTRDKNETTFILLDDEKLFFRLLQLAMSDTLPSAAGTAEGGRQGYRSRRGGSTHRLARRRRNQSRQRRRNHLGNTI